MVLAVLRHNPALLTGSTSPAPDYHIVRRAAADASMMHKPASTSISSGRSAAMKAQLPPSELWPAPGTYADRVVGCFLGALSGDALGAAVEGWSAKDVQKKFPRGLSSFQDCRLGRGCYTDDGQMLLALAAALVNQQGACQASAAATEYAKAFDDARGYGGAASKILAQLRAQLQQGPLPPTLGSELLNKGGSYGNGGAMRVAPLGLVYRNAPPHVLEAALLQSLIPTHHVHPWGVEGALAQALAVAHLSRLQQPDARSSQEPQEGVDGSGGNGPPAGAVQLLQELQRQLEGLSHVMHSRLCQMEQALQQLHTTADGPKKRQQSWKDFFATPAWDLELATAAAVAPGEDGSGFQIKGTDAVAAAIWACVAHWEADAVDAIVAAVHYGGDTDTIACMTGALVGARHGTAWLPADWMRQLEQNKGDAQCFFNMSAVGDVLGLQSTAADGSKAAKQQPQPGLTPGHAADDAQHHAGVQLVHTTLNMGRDGAVLLGRLLALLDCRAV